ncbi:N-acetyl-alpha-D-glucosaminyl L-malate synthase BshA (plasmid) [Legionella adelaidensis]|uniref:Glycosyltransferase, lipopolysaccharide biosynthesis protein n=1 Tax=Legionella adelaidensis TaxID=45056 RepID=A0A0W0R4T5_9GAMM|nr:glycosyltransferase [Legionella adelaidensis]KTC66075.1 glycosyltransferase, lipopolysaccharide biosynthesis protein [Legionella adelaidensis]VEH85707.1 N-acetyl-alpha-D-glucosaminyl L-malate synthase BshA [Legionella adelaidensis]
MKVLLNCSTLIKGGSLQVASAVFKDAIKDNEINWYFAVTQSLFSHFKGDLESMYEQGKVIILDTSPARNRKARKFLKNKVLNEQFDAIFTLFGPAYIKFSVPHLCGIADGWVTHSTKASYNSLRTIKDKIYTYLLCKYKLWWYQKADRWCVEAPVARNGFLSKTNKDPKSVIVIPNAVNQLIQQYVNVSLDRKLTEKINVFCLGADYWHKNYHIIPSLLVKLQKKLPLNVQFLVTLPKDSKVFAYLMSKARELGVQDHIVNLGPLKLKEVIEVYKTSHILFFPSLLETFSITPLEALYMNMPMIISRIEANLNIIGEHAHYVDSQNSEEVAETFLKVIENYSLEVKKLCTLKENNYFGSITTASNRFNLYKNIIKKMVYN